MTAAPTVELRPARNQWVKALRAAPWNDDQQRTRREIGLPAARPIVMSGHQVEFWHPGILAKYFALRLPIDSYVRAEPRIAETESSRAPSPVAVWLEVDTDVLDGFRIAYPAAGPARAHWTLAATRAGMPIMSVPPCAVATGATDVLDPPPSHDFARNGINAIARALASHAGEPSLARQIALARADLLAWAGPVPLTLYASVLSRTSAFAEAVARIAQDPQGCAEAFNRAVARHPEARVRPLMTSPRLELPLWVIEPAHPRRRAFADEITAIPPTSLAPRAILLTTFLRAFACDLFIHGLGGERYDRVSERWAGEWWGWRLAPTATTTATLRLPLLDEPLPEPAEIDRARWLAWHARSEPALLGDQAAAAEKAAILARLRAAGSRRERAEWFSRLRALITHVRERAADRLNELESLAAALHAQRARAAVAYDRTWPFPLYPHPMLVELKSTIESRFEEVV
jgi:hypothetical protein